MAGLRSRALPLALGALVMVAAPFVGGCSKSSPLSATAPSTVSGIIDARPTTGSITLTYTGQGLTLDGPQGYILQTELCGVQFGAEKAGPYLLWVLTATDAFSATITGPRGTDAMTKTSNGTFKYVSDYYTPGTLIGTVSATYDGKSTAQLTISHGCARVTNGAWCSPGFWRNAQDGAWALTGFNRNVDTFNPNVYNVWYGALLSPDQTLQFVLDNPQTYSGAPNAGTSRYPLNAFNATAAMLTDSLPGYSFNFAVMTSGSAEACPIDHFGHVK
jgi:hypothetical protein